MSDPLSRQEQLAALIRKMDDPNLSDEAVKNLGEIVNRMHENAARERQEQLKNDHPGWRPPTR